MSEFSFRRVSLVRAEFPADGRVLMISDIHGHANVLSKLLRKSAFSPRDTLVVVGDLLEKGAESLRVVRTLMALSATHRVYTLIGNMDVWTLSRLLSDREDKRRELLERAPKMTAWWGGCFFGELCAELGIPVSPDMDLDGTIMEIRRRFAPELAFLTGLPTILDTPYATFVHGGLPHEDLDALVGQDNMPLLKCDDFVSRGLRFQKYVVVGHWPTPLYRDRIMDMSPLILRDRRIVSLDGGCGVKKSGQLNCVILPAPSSKDFSFLWEDDLPRVTALTAQPAGTSDPVYIKWTDREVEVLHEGPDFARVLHHGRETLVPAWAVDHETPGRLNTDFTDYRLPVEPGDELSQVFVCGGKLYARKQSVLGWYEGQWTTKGEDRYGAS